MIAIRAASRSDQPAIEALLLELLLLLLEVDPMAMASERKSIRRLQEEQASGRG